MPHPVFAASNIAVITGAASGIGLAIARLCAAHNLKMVLTDVNGPLLQEAAGTLEAPKENVETVTMDVGDRGAWASVKEKVDQKFGGKVDFLVLNAGVGPKTDWEDVESFKKLYNTNIFGVLNGIAEFLPTLKKNSTPSSIVILGSKQGITNPPSNPGYNSSKSAVKTLTEHLSFDLKETPISVHLLVPGWTFTGMTGAGKADKPAGAWTADQVAERLAIKMEKGEFYVICPDNDVTEEMDRKRIAWAVGDVIEGRPALSRWRGGEWGEKHKAFMEGN
ncbi:NAD(P)-binding protein [Morchella conica CCBAS932]|uniref:NAD(P)-binding protein n=1 Tax=Morchella conica CCBAS932 TaxID=1392247 RepID=A0A3N4KTA3_9PEZI|nr:NAD(P)-binding protein [Morchella conica CCBAS932]